jgi:D-3-phosphoglycerate dehydrogenase
MSAVMNRQKNFMSGSLITPILKPATGSGGLCRDRIGGYKTPMNYLVSEAYDIQALARLRANPSLNETKDLAAAEILMIRSRTRVDRALLARAPKLKLVVTSTSGFDHIDWRACAEAGIVVTHTPDANANATAELTLLLILATERRLTAAIKNVRGNQWREALSRPRGLTGLTLGLVGLGRVGGRVATLAHAFGLRIQAYDPYVVEERFAETRAERIGLIELLRTSDYVSLHVPLTRETKHLMNQPTFNEMSRDAYLINTCRGPVVDETHLLSALDDRVIAGAAMDVIEREPPPAGHRLLNHPALLLTPHIGAFTDEAWARASDEAVAKVEAFARGETVGDTLPLSNRWFMGTI